MAKRKRSTTGSISHDLALRLESLIRTGVSINDKLEERLGQMEAQHLQTVDAVSKMGGIVQELEHIVRGVPGDPNNPGITSAPVSSTPTPAISGSRTAGAAGKRA